MWLSFSWVRVVMYIKSALPKSWSVVLGRHTGDAVWISGK